MGSDHLRLTLWAQILGWEPHLLWHAESPAISLSGVFLYRSLFLILPRPLVHSDP